MLPSLSGCLRIEKFLEYEICVKCLCHLCKAVCGLFLTGLDRTDQKILRRVLHIDELKDLCTVPLRFKKFRADSVCQERGHSFFEDSIFENRFEKFVLDLVVQLMLAARHGKDDLCPHSTALASA